MTKFFLGGWGKSKWQEHSADRWGGGHKSSIFDRLDDKLSQFGRHDPKGTKGSGGTKGGKWDDLKDSKGSGGTKGTDDTDACASDTYHNGGIEGKFFSKWFDQHLADKFDHLEDKFDRIADKFDGKGGTRGWGGTKGSGGTNGSGGTKGWGGTKGTGGTKGWGGTKGGCGTNGSGGTKGTEEPPVVEPEKTTLNFTMGTPAEINISVTETPEGQLFFNITQHDYVDEPTDVDGIFMNLTDDSKLSSLNFFPDENAEGRDVTDIQAEADGVTGLPDGAQAGGTFDIGLQFGQVDNSKEGLVQTTNFTLWSDDGPVTFEDIDLSGMRLIVDSEGPDGEVLGVSASDDPDFMDGDGDDDMEVTYDDAMALMNQPVEEDDLPAPSMEEEEEELDLIY